MPPVHITPLRSVGIILVVEMVDAILVDHTVGVIHPAIGWAMVVGWPVVILGRGVKGVGESKLLEADRLTIKSHDLDCRRRLVGG